MKVQQGEERVAYVDYEKKGHIAYITLNRPERLNALGSELIRQLGEAEANFALDDDAWVAIYTGAGERAFCAGRDLKEAAEGGGGGGGRAQTPFASRAARPTEITKPTIAAINGICYGGGFELAQRCDVRICSENATFAMAEVTVGLMPVTGLFTLPRLIGQGNAMWLLLSGEAFDAQEAHRLGLVTRVVPLADLLPTATSMAETVCGNSPLAVRAIKQLVKTGAEVPMDYAMRLGSSLISSVWGSEDAKEGAAAFAEKRKPVWRMR
jgi:enoyl-CoA hydratase/carnithine racemase